jgi:hypothetical protein
LQVGLIAFVPIFSAEELALHETGEVTEFPIEANDFIKDMIVDIIIIK